MKNALTSYEVRQEFKKRILEDIYSRMGPEWYKVLEDSIKSDSIKLDVCDYATMLFNCMTEEDFKKFEYILNIPTDWKEDGHIVNITNEKLSSLMEDFGLYIYNNLPPLVRGILDFNKITPNTLAIYANLGDITSTYYKTVCRAIYQSYHLNRYMKALDERDYYEIDIVKDIIRICSESPSFDDIFLRNKAFPNVFDIVYDKDKLEEINTEYWHKLEGCKIAIRHFFNNEIDLAYNALLAIADMSINTFSV